MPRVQQEVENRIQFLYHKIEDKIYPLSHLLSSKAQCYFLQTETCAEMSLHVPRVLAYFRQVILRKDMDNDSALLLNAGAHYVKVMHSKVIFFLHTIIRIITIGLLSMACH